MLHNYYHFFRMEISQKSVNVIYRCIKLSLKIYPFYSLQKKCMSVKKNKNDTPHIRSRKGMDGGSIHSLHFSINKPLVSGDVDVGKRCKDFNIQLSMSTCRIRFDPFLIYRFKCIEY